MDPTSEDSAEAPTDAPSEAAHDAQVCGDRWACVPEVYPGEHATYRAERCDDVGHLERYARDACAITREGAALGLHALRARITATLERLASDDPSPGVRATAGDA